MTLGVEAVATGLAQRLDDAVTVFPRTQGDGVYARQLGNGSYRIETG